MRSAKPGNHLKLNLRQEAPRITYFHWPLETCLLLFQGPGSDLFPPYVERINREINLQRVTFEQESKKWFTVVLK